MLSTHEVMTELYLRGREFSVEAAAWLDANDDAKTTLGVIELVFAEYEVGDIDAEIALREIAAAAGYDLGTPKAQERSGA